MHGQFGNRRVITNTVTSHAITIIGYNSIMLVNTKMILRNVCTFK